MSPTLEDLRAAARAGRKIYAVGDGGEMRLWPAAAFTLALDTGHERDPMPDFAIGKLAALELRVERRRAKRNETYQAFLSDDRALIEAERELARERAGLEGK